MQIRLLLFKYIHAKLFYAYTSCLSYVYINTIYYYRITLCSVRSSVYAWKQNNLVVLRAVYRNQVQCRCRRALLHRCHYIYILSDFYFKNIYIGFKFIICAKLKVFKFVFSHRQNRGCVVVYKLNYIRFKNEFFYTAIKK